MLRVTVGRKKRKHRPGAKGGPGRPAGTQGGQGKVPSLVDPKPIHDYVLLLHLAGKTNKEAAETLGLSPQQVSNVIRSEWAAGRIEELRGTVTASVMSQIDGQLLVLAEKSVENLKSTVEAKISPFHSMKRHQDKVGLQLLEGTGFLRKARDDGGDGGARLAFGEAATERITRALERARRVRETDFELQNAEVVEVKEDVA